jgi:hypothetical protein
MSQQGGRRRIDLLLRVLGATDVRVGERTVYKRTTTGSYEPEDLQALVDYLGDVCPGFWDGFGDVEPSIFAPLDPVECVLLNDLTVAILDTGWSQFPTEAGPQVDGGAVQDLIGYLLLVIY